MSYTEQSITGFKSQYRFLARGQPDVSDASQTAEPRGGPEAHGIIAMCYKCSISHLNLFASIPGLHSIQ